VVRVSSTASIHQLQQQCTRTAVKMAASALWGLVRQMLRVLSSLSAGTASVLQQLAALLALPQCLGTAHPEATLQLARFAAAASPKPVTPPSSKGGFNSKISRSALRRGLSSLSVPFIGCRYCDQPTDGKSGKQLSDTRQTFLGMPGGTPWRYRQQPLPLPVAAKLPSGRPFTVALDLDETLVWTQRPPVHGGCGPGQVEARALQGAFTVQCEVASGEWGPLTVVPRPGLRQFLQSAAAVAELVLFTASMPGYAEPILDAIDPDGTLFAARLFRDSTVTTCAGLAHVKDLSRLGRDLARTIIIDNEPRSFILQPANGVPIPAFTGASGDGQLLGVVGPLVAQLAAHGDVRPTLERHFRMTSWFQRRMRHRSVWRIGSFTSGSANGGHVSDDYKTISSPQQ